MTYVKVSNALLVGLSTDTKPTSYATHTLFIEADTGIISQYNGTSWAAVNTPGSGGSGVSASSPNTWSAAQTFNDGDLVLENPLGTFGATVKAGAQTSATTFTFPVSTADTILLLGASQTVTNKSMSGSSNTFTNISNSAIAAAAAIAYSKLALTGSVVNADIATSAAIAYSKLSLASSILNSDISASAGIAYSKLSLATSILNSDISASAAIAYSKLSLSNSVVNADIASAAAIAWTKISKTGSVLNDIANINAASPSNNDVLTYNTSTSKWINQAPSSWSGPLPYVFPDGTTTYSSNGYVCADGTALTTFGNLARVTGTGTLTQKSDLLTTEGFYTNVATASTNTFTGYYSSNSTATSFVSTDSSPTMSFRVRFGSVSSTLRFAMGLTSGNNTLTSDTLSATSGYAALVGRRTTDTDFQLITNNAGTATYTDSGTAVAASTWYTIVVNAPSGGPATLSINGSQVASTSTGFPATGGMMAPILGINASSGSQSIDIHYYTLRKAF